MKTLPEVLRILNGSKRFQFDGSILIVSDYFTGDTVKLDLANLDEDMLEALQVDSDEV